MAGSASATTRPKERCGASHWEGATGPSPAPNAAPTAPPSCSPSSPPHASTTSTQKPGSPTSSLASPIFPPRVCTNCCPGNGSACAKPTCPPISRPPEPLAPHHKPASARAPATIPRPCPCEYPACEEAVSATALCHWRLLQIDDHCGSGLCTHRRRFQLDREPRPGVDCR